MLVSFSNIRPAIKNQYIKKQKPKVVQSSITSGDNFLNARANNVSFLGIITQPTNPDYYIKKYINPNIVRKAIDNNSNIDSILGYYFMEPKIYLENIDDSLKSHLLTTHDYAEAISKKLNLDSNSTKILTQASLVHDIGKALIPDIIIQKPKQLTADEKRIADLHSQLGYEILKTTDLNEDVIEAVKLHHTPFYQIQDNKIAQILSVADAYSALREKRPYRDIVSKEEAFKRMYEVPNFSRKIIDALCEIECS